MKQCPKCLRDYPDDSLRFCLDDGVGLIEKFVTKPNDQRTLMYSAAEPTVRISAGPTSPMGARPHTPNAPPSNAGRALAVIATVLGLLSWALLLMGIVASAVDADDTLVGGVVVLSIPGACLGVVLGLFGLYRAYRAKDGQGARKTAILAVFLNLVFVLGLAALLVLGMSVNLMK